MDTNILLMLILLFGVVVVAAVLFAVFFKRREISELNKDQTILKLNTHNAELLSDNNHLVLKVEELKKELSSREESYRVQLKEYEEKYSVKLKEQELTYRQTLKENEERAQVAMREQLDTNARQLKMQMDTLKLVFNETAEKLFEEKTKGLNEANNRDIQEILAPLKEKMEEFKKEVRETKDKSIQNTANIETQIKLMLDKATSLGKEANNLASALKGNNKIQGNWGEMHLENLLQDAGFVEGVDYYKQQTIKDDTNSSILNEDTGRKMIPDYIVTFPDNKVVILDSKVSMSAYMDYCDKDATPEQLENAKRRHIESVKSHIAELSRKDYASGIRKTDKNSLKYVIMYIPNENAFQLFFQENKQLWNDAFSKNVIITGDFYLITMLAIIRYIWDEHSRQKNSEAIANTAAELLERVNLFMTTFNSIGKNIRDMKENFEKANNRLFARGQGSKSVAVTSEKLQKLGVDCKITLPSLPAEQTLFDKNIQ